MDIEPAVVGSRRGPCAWFVARLSHRPYRSAPDSIAGPRGMAGQQFRFSDRSRGVQSYFLARAGQGKKDGPSGNKQATLRIVRGGAHKDAAKAILAALDGSNVVR